MPGKFTRALFTSAAAACAVAIPAAASPSLGLAVGYLARMSGAAALSSPLAGLAERPGGLAAIRSGGLRPLPGAAVSAGPVQGLLLGVTALSPASAWAVGFRCVPGCASMSRRDATLAERWNGRTWTMVASPDPGTDWDYLQSVSAASAADAWAVGEDSLRLNSSTEISGTLTEHWNGRRWATVPSPSPGTSDNELLGVSAVSAANAWAVGDSQGTGGHQALILHWNGKAWSRVPIPAVSRYASTLQAVRAVSATSAWAVGGYVNAAGTAEDTLILRWNGRIWTKVPSPSPAAASSALAGISAVSAASAWAAGASCVSACGDAAEVDRTLILRWNGRTWTTAVSPAQGALSAVSAATPASTFAVGGYCASACGTASEVDHAVILRWNGKTWTTAAGPHLSALLAGVAAASAASAWAVGYSATSSSRPLILHWNGRTWSAR